MENPLFITADALQAAIQSPEASILQEGRNLTVRTKLAIADGTVEDVAVKRFPPPSAFRVKLDKLRNMPGKARRAWQAAEHLSKRIPGSTPAPIAIVETGTPDAPGESWFVTRFEPDLVSFKAKLIEHYAAFGPCPALMEILRVVAENIARIHHIGFFHGDLGNQNIMIAPKENTQEPRIMLIDLNRCRLHKGPLSTHARARDLSRIHLPSDLRRVFLEMYWRGAIPPKPFLRAEKRCRKAYAFHCATRRLRHPFRKNTPSAEGEYPHPRDIWIWDPKSEQAIASLRPRDRHRYQSITRVTHPLFALARSLPKLKRNLTHQRNISFERPLLLFAERAFVSLSADPERFEKECALLTGLGCIGTHLRFYAHEPIAVTDFKIAAVQHLKEMNCAVAISLVQHRETAANPEKWVHFCTHVLKALHDTVMWVEVLHAVNRVKWGIWNFSELRKLLATTSTLAAQFPDVSFVGPSVIDFEWDYLSAALRCLPQKPKFHALSCHLYVDRRGPPEAMQGKFNALGKLQLLRAMATLSDKIQDHLIVSEFNWPLKHTREWSPVGSPYVSPGDRQNDPSVTEKEAAAYTLRYLFIGLCSSLADQMVFWSLAAHGFGLVDPGITLDCEWRQRPAFTALKTFFRLFRHAHFIRALHRGEGGAWAMHFASSKGRYIIAAWSSEPDAAIPLPIAPFPVNKIIDMYGAEIPTPKHLSGNPIYLLQ